MGYSGTEQRLMAAIEAVAGIRQDFVSTDAVDFTGIKLKPSRAFHNRKTHTGSQSSIGATPGKFAGEWEYEHTILPATSVASDPSQHAFFMSAFGERITNGGTDIIYQLFGRTGGGALPSLQLGHWGNNSWLHQAQMGITKKFSFEVGNDTPPMFKSSGEFAHYSVLEGEPALSADEIAAAVNIGLSATDIRRMYTTGQGFRVEFSDGEDNGGAGYIVTGIDTAVNTFAISPPLVNPVLAGVTVQPFMPTPSYPVVDELPGSQNELTIDGVVYPFISFKVDVDTGFVLRKKHASSLVATGICIDENRVVQGEMSLYLEDGSYNFNGHGFDGITVPLNMKMGIANSSLEYVEHVFPSVRLDVQSEKEIPDTNCIEVTIKWYAEKSVADNDEYQCRTAL